MKLLLAIGALCITAGMSSGGSSTLVIDVRPEAYVNPASLDLTFNVNNPGQIIDSTPLQATGWVRALPAQRIRVTASAALFDPAGVSFAPQSLQWAGVLTRATGGAATGVCTSGSFLSGGPQDLITGWQESGIASCTLTFSLATASAWVKGSYHARIALAAAAQ